MRSGHTTTGQRHTLSSNRFASRFDSISKVKISRLYPVCAALPLPLPGDLLQHPIFNMPQVYNVQPSMGQQTLRDVKGPANIAGRSLSLPPIYEWCGQEPHPQRIDDLDVSNTSIGKTYIFLIDPSDEGKETADVLGQAQRIPLGREQVARDQGTRHTGGPPM